MRHKLSLLLLILSTLSCQWQQSKIYQVQKYDASLIVIDSLIKPDSLVTAYITPFRDSVTAHMNQSVGRSESVLAAYVPESPLSNFVSDLILSESILMAKEKGLPTPDISIMNIKGLRTILPQGNITLGNVFQLMPFENAVVFIQLKGGDVQEMFDHMASMKGDGLGGASFTISNGKAVHIKINNEPLENQKTYTIATSDYLANGGDRYYVMTKSKITELGITLRDMILHHIEKLTRENKTIRATEDKRISYEN